MTVDDYLKLPYHLGMMLDSSGESPAWVSWVEELPGCLSQGDTPEEAATMLREAMELWLEVAIERGDRIPAPRPDSNASGRLLLRMPSTLHQSLDALARREGVSLNQYVVALLAGATGWRAMEQPIAGTEPVSRRRSA